MADERQQQTQFPDDPLDVLVPGTHYKAYLVASLAMGSSPRAAVEHYGLPAEQVQWAMNFHLENGPAIYRAIDQAQALGEELGGKPIQEGLAAMRKNAYGKMVADIEAGVFDYGVKNAVKFGGDVFEALAARYHVKKLMLVYPGTFLEDKLPDGRPIIFVYDPSEDHSPGDYVALAQGLYNLVGYPMCLVNRERVFDEMAEEWTKIVELASYAVEMEWPSESDGEG